MNVEVPLSKNIDNTEHNSKNQVIESLKKFLWTLDQLSDDPASIRTQPSIDIGKLAMVEERGTMGFTLGMAMAADGFK